MDKNCFASARCDSLCSDFKTEDVVKIASWKLRRLRCPFHYSFWESERWTWSSSINLRGENTILWSSKIHMGSDARKPTLWSNFFIFVFLSILIVQCFLVKMIFISFVCVKKYGYCRRSKTLGKLTNTTRLTRRQSFWRTSLIKSTL